MSTRHRLVAALPILVLLLAPCGGGSGGKPTTAGEPCGSTSCGTGEFCCNPSCSICAPAGGACTQQFCG